MMHRRTRLLLVMVVVLFMVVVLLLNSAAWAQSPVTDRTKATLTGGSYRLITDVPQVTGGLSGAQYRLLPAAPALGEGCCCKALLPCIVK